MTKIDIISGFLGAGKTTLIKKMLEEAFQDEKVVLIENEYGEVGIDGGFMKDAGIEIRELNSGCICCTLVGDFSKSLNEVIETWHPNRIIIEPSGVGKLSDVMASVKEMEGVHDVEVNALVTVANAAKASKQMRAFGEFFNNQIKHASTIVLSRTQNVTPEKVEKCVKDMRKLNEKAAIITTPWDELKAERILEVLERQSSLEEELMKEAIAHHHEHEHDHDGHEHAGHHGHDHDEHEHAGHHENVHDEHEHAGRHGHDHDEHEHAGRHGHDHEGHEHTHEGCDHDHGHDHHADEVFTSWGRETSAKYTKEGIEDILKTLCDTEDYGLILRVKGMVPAKDGTWIYFDMTPGEYEIREGQPDYTGRFCVIGTEVDEAGLEKLFHLI